MVMLASSAGSLVLKRVKPVVMVASSGISFVLETGFGEKEADGCLALLGCSPFSASFSLCWSGSDVEWQWLLDEEDDELKMALAVLVRLSSFCPFFFVRLPLSVFFPLFTVLSLCLLLFLPSLCFCFPPFFSSFFQSSSPAFIG
ncbi:hypothetical protein NC652_031418 [Populus alba x Populus x berolinensis]|nr:hypothetical protein NC652_031418 [Populus alba x Populus x berolinensis]